VAPDGEVSGSGSDFRAIQAPQRVGTSKTVAANPPVAFVPIVVLGRPEGETSPPSDAAAPSRDVSRYDLGKRSGLIEIDMVDGTRLRVDAAVDEQAFKRVWDGLKTTS
jgi:hypothetical protein